MESQIQRRGKPLHVETRVIVSNVEKYFMTEANLFKDNEASDYFKRVQQRVADATGLSKRTLSQIVNETDECVESSSSKSLGKGRLRNRFCPDPDVSHYGFIRRLVYDFHLKLQKNPCIDELKEICAESIDYKGSRELLKKILEQMGFHYLTTEDHRRVLVERFDVRLKRIQYLRDINNYRAVHKNIVYMSVLKFAIPRTSKEKMREHLTLMVAGNEQGLVPGVSVLPGDLSDLCTQWEDWLRTQLLPHLELETVLVVDNAPVHNKLVNEPPAPEASKQEMIRWLSLHDIPADPGLRKPQLYEYILQCKDMASEYSADKLLAAHGHHVLRLPAYHSEFNPVHTIHSQLRVYVNKQAADLDETEFRKFVIEKLKSISQEEWRRACERVRECEREFQEMERSIDEFLDQQQLPSDSSDDGQSEDEDIAMRYVT